MRTKKTEPRLGKKDKSVIKFIFRRFKKTVSMPTAAEITKRFEFTRQSHYYYMQRLVHFGVLVRVEKGNYQLVADLPEEFEIMYADIK